MKIRNKQTGQIFEVVAGTRYPSFFEEVKDDEIKVGEPKVEFEIEELKEEDTEPAVEETEKVDKKEANVKKTTKKLTKKGAKKNGKTK